MSMPKRMTVNCSQCGKPLSVTVFESVNSDYADDIAKQIMSGDLFNAECPHCKYVSHLEYDILYHDLRHGAMVWVVHQNSPEYFDKIAGVRTAPKLPYKTMRIVNDMNALKEKVSCLESNRDDRIIELCKVFTVYNLLSQQPDFNFRNAFYTALSGQELIYIYDEDGNNVLCELPEKAYDYLRDLYYGSHYATQLDDNYPIVDYEWAENIIPSLINAESEQSSSNEEDEEVIEPSIDVATSDNKVCPKCKAVLPGDSEFCQGCGTKLSSYIPEPIQSNDTSEELLSEFEIMEVKGSHPIIIQSAHLYCSADREKFYLRCKFKSLSDKVISALMVDIFCLDVWGNELPTIRDAQILDLSPKRDEVFGYSRKIPIIDVNTRTVNVKLKRIRFADGTIEECSGEETKIPAVVTLKEHFNSSELTKQYIYETSNKASVMPMRIGGFWMCSCGKINSDTEDVCVHCSADKKIVFDALNEEYLAERRAAYIENKRIEEEKQRRIEQKRQVEIERQRIAQIQNERDIAIQKRIAAMEAADLKKKKIKVIIICIIVALMAIGIVGGIIDNVGDNKLRNFATQKMSDDYSNVYADVISMVPEYYVYTTNDYSLERRITDVVCRCTTVEGKTIWASISISDYPGGNAYNEDSLEEQYYSYAMPLRLSGSVTTAKKVQDRLANILGNIYVLDVDDLKFK